MRYAEYYIIRFARFVRVSYLKARYVAAMLTKPAGTVFEIEGRKVGRLEFIKWTLRAV